MPNIVYPPPGDDRLVIASDLVSSADIAAMFGMRHQQQATNMISLRPNFPEPVAVVANGRTRLWLRSEVNQWNIDRKKGKTHAREHTE